jgi:hypothetical protein
MSSLGRRVHDVLRASFLLATLLLVSGCGREEAVARLQHDLPVDDIQILHARFPCRSPDIHFFGYRFRANLKGQTGDGDICLDLVTKEWSWQLLPNSTLSHLNQRK